LARIRWKGLSKGRAHLPAMRCRMVGRSGRVRSREQNIILVVLAVVIVALLWNFLGVILRLVLFAPVVYLVYRLLQSWT